MNKCNFIWQRFGIAPFFLFAFLAVFSMRCQAAPFGPLETPVPIAVDPIKADPTRNLVYFVDRTNNRLLAFDTAAGQQVASASVDDGVTQGDIAISVDGTKLYLAESAENEIMVFSLPDLAPLPTVSLSFPPLNIASAVSGRLFATINTSLSTTALVEISPTDGSILQTFGTTEQYYFKLLLRTNADGTNLYAGDLALSGDDNIFVYSLSGGLISAATPYGYLSANMIDFTPDEANGRIYVMNGGIYGINVILTANDDFSTVWPLTGAYGVGIGFNPALNVVFGASGSPVNGDIREFSRTDGTPLNDWVVATDDMNPVQHQGIAMTANGNVFYVRSTIDNPGPQPSSSIIGLISSNALPPAFSPTVPQTIAFPLIGTAAMGESIVLAAIDSLGLPITYSVVSGPATIVGSTVTFTGVGQVVLAVAQAGTFLDIPVTVMQTVTVTLPAQTISAFSIIPDKTFGDAPFTINLPMSTAHLPVIVTVKSGPATISGNRITLTGGGVVTLAANQPGNTKFLPAVEVTTSFIVHKAAQTIAAFKPIATKSFGDAPFTVLPSKASSGLPVTVSVQSGPATILNNVVTITGSGTVVLAANQAGNANYNAAPTITINVSGTPQTIAAFAPIAAQTFGEAPFTVTPPTASSGLAATVTVKSGPATMVGNLVTLTGAGKVVLVANQAGDATYAAATAPVTTTFTVNKSAQTIAAFAPITVQSFNVPFAVTVPTASSGLPVTVTVKSGPAKISGNVVVLTGIGTVVLLANQAGDINYNAAPPITTSFFVVQNSQTISAFSAIAAKTYGDAPFIVTVPTASSGLKVTIKVLSGPAVLAGNKVTVTGVGTVVLAANQAGNVDYTAAPQVTTSFAVNQASQTIAAFKTIPAKLFSATPFAILVPKASSGLPVTVTVLSGPATISGNKVTMTGVGTVVLAADQAGNANYTAATEVTTSFVVN